MSLKIVHLGRDETLYSNILYDSVNWLDLSLTNVTLLQATISNMCKNRVIIPTQKNTSTHNIHGSSYDLICLGAHYINCIILSFCLERAQKSF